MSSAGQGRSAHMGQRRGEDLITSSARTSRRSASGLRLASSFAWARARFGFVRTDTLNQLREDKRITNAHRHITYITRPREADIRQLAGKKVSFDVKGSGTGRRDSRTCASCTDSTYVDAFPCPGVAPPRAA